MWTVASVESWECGILCRANGRLRFCFALRQAEQGTRVTEVCRKMGVSQATFYNWKKKYGGMGVPELRRLRQLEEENKQLKQLVADLSLDKQMLQDVIKKKL
jgi:putative transposase